MLSKKLSLASLAMISVLTCGGLLAADDAAPAGLTWMTNAAEAMALAKKEHKVVLADFTGSDWCGWCKKLKADVYSTPEFKALAKDKLILLEVDFPQNTPQSDEVKKQNKELGDKFKIDGYPTNIFLTPEGAEIGRIGGYEPKDDWLKSAKEILAKAK
jgi:protein disulfide-isomerase